MKKQIKADNTIKLKEENNAFEAKVPELITLCHKEQGNRDYQQDNVYVTPGSKLANNHRTRVMAVVCDGMGGMADGGLASSIAVDTLKNGFEIIKNATEVNIPAFFLSGIKAADKKISSIPKVNGKGSGTTMVAVIADDNYLYWASVGDSSIYVIHNNEMKKITTDHNYSLRLRMLYESGQITAEEYGIKRQTTSKRQQEALISFLGMGNVSLMDISQQPFEMSYGDIVILCSDGITKTLDDNQIYKIMSNENEAIEKKAKILVDAAIRRNPFTQDNTSVAILQYIESKITR